MRRGSLILGGSVVGLVVGFLLGGVRPRIEAEQLRTELSDAREQLKSGRRSSGSSARFLPIPGFGDLGQRPGSGNAAGNQPKERPREERPRRWWRPPREREGAPTSEEPRPNPPSEVSESDDGNERQRREGFEAAAAVQKVRAQQSRAALKEKANLSDEQLARVDEVVLKMNKELAPFADQLTQLASAEQEPQPLELLYVSQEVSAILYKGQTEFEATVGPEPLEKVDAPSKQIWNYVDLEMFKGAAETMRARREASDAGTAFPPAPSGSASQPTP
ncbi:MAG: hypothetical protein SFV15_03000 [Polyangiaceae bacterium]|nr:hypothetical protein [Polyangiaceae bacterium]